MAITNTWLDSFHWCIHKHHFKLVQIAVNTQFSNSDSFTKSISPVWTVFCLSSVQISNRRRNGTSRTLYYRKAGKIIKHLLAKIIYKTSGPTIRISNFFPRLRLISSGLRLMILSNFNTCEPLSTLSLSRYRTIMISEDYILLLFGWYWYQDPCKGGRRKFFCDPYFLQVMLLWSAGKARTRISSGHDQPRPMNNPDLETIHKCIYN